MIAGERVDLVPLSDDEAEAILAGARDGRAWSPGYPTPGDAEVAGWPMAADARFAPFQIVERATGLVVGGVGCHGAPGVDGAVEVGYGLAVEARGRGLATEALGALVRFLEEQPEVQEVRASTDADNVPSERVLERCRFRRIAEAGGATAWRRGRP